MKQVNRTKVNSYPSQLVLKSTRTQVNSYPGQIVSNTVKVMLNANYRVLIPFVDQVSGHDMDPYSL